MYRLAAPRPVALTALVAATAVAAGGAYLGVQSFRGAPAASAADSAASAAPVRVGALPASPAIEARYGVRFTRVDVIADGGLIDVRFQILDPDRAQPLLGHHATAKMVLRDERRNVVLDTRAMMPGDSTLVPGETYFLLYRNTVSTVRPGDKVDVLIEDGRYRIDGITVQ